MNFEIFVLYTSFKFFFFFKLLELFSFIVYNMNMLDKISKKLISKGLCFIYKISPVKKYYSLNGNNWKMAELFDIWIRYLNMEHSLFLENDEFRRVIHRKNEMPKSIG